MDEIKAITNCRDDDGSAKEGDTFTGSKKSSWLKCFKKKSVSKNNIWETF